MLLNFHDIETTGFMDGDAHRIVEIAMVIVDLQQVDGVWVAEQRGEFERRINPMRSIPPATTAIHGIANSDVMDCPTLDKIAPTLAAILARADLWVAHNGKWFDGPFMRREFTRCGVPLVVRPIFDTMLEGRFALPDGKVPTLGELCWALDVPYDPEKAHAALYDVQVMRDCVLRGLNLGAFSLPTILSHK